VDVDYFFGNYFLLESRLDDFLDGNQ